MGKEGNFCGYGCQKQGQKAQRSCLPVHCSKYATAFEQEVVQQNTAFGTIENHLVHNFLVLATPPGINISLVGGPMPTYSLTNVIVLAHSLILMTF